MADPGAARAATAHATEREAWALLLSVEGLGPAAFGGLLATYGSGDAILAAAGRRGAPAAFSAIVAAAQGRTHPDLQIGQRIVALAADPGSRLAVLREASLQIVTLDDDRYPARLRAIDLPPPVLLVDGDISALSAARAVAIVGTRRPSEMGRLIAARIASAVARAGAVVISGLAVGIDGAAHAAVVSETRPTVAVIGSGHRRLYPRAHVRLAADVVRTGGAVVSELFPDTGPGRGTFPQRNRLISGLADATIVVEAGGRSGALITADWALRQGRECFVVPGPIDEPRSAGCLAFYREFPELVGIVTGIPELLVDLRLDGHDGESAPRGRGRPSVAALLIELGSTARQVGQALTAGKGTVDELVAATGHEPATVLGAITLLEMHGLATSTYGRYRAAGRLAAAEPGSRRRTRAPSGAVERGFRAGDGAAPGLPRRSGPC
jgi:DNA processing protein